MTRPEAVATRATTTRDRPALPDRSAFWHWVGDALRPIIGWGLVVLGGVSLLLGWYGVSGQSLTAKQLPYLVSGGLTGIGLIVVAAVFLATDDFRRQLVRLDDLERKVDDLYRLLVDEVGTLPEAASTEQLVALPSGSSYHRSTCALVAGKPSVETVTPAAIDSRKLTPCRVCAPEPAHARR